MSSLDFEKLVKQQEAKRNLLTRKVKKDIRKVYYEVYKQTNESLSKQNKDTLNIKYLKSLQKSLEGQINALNKDLKTNVKTAIEKSVDCALNSQLNFFKEISKKYNLELASTFEDMFATIHKDVVAEIVGGKLYKDRAGLSKRIWADTKRFNKDIDMIIAKGIAKKKGSYEVAKDLVKYLNPNIKHPVMNGVRGKANSNAYRLAHTSIMHAYQMAQKRSCEKNPFIEKIKWLASNSHRTCEACLSKNGNLYSPSDLPLDHPNGLCTTIPIIEKDFDQIGEELNQWINGEENKELDEWLGNYM